MTMNSTDQSPKAIIFIGLQASGKTTYYRQHFQEDYVHINLDTLHTRNKETKLMEDCLRQGKSFVVDNTNPTAVDRKKYIEAARAQGYVIEGYFFRSIVQACVERNSQRTGKACVPNRAIAFTSNRLEMPFYEEGFDKLYFVHIQDGEFVTEPWTE